MASEPQKGGAKMPHPILKITRKDGTIEIHEAKSITFYKDPKEVKKVLEELAKKQKEGKNG